MKTTSCTARVLDPLAQLIKDWNDWNPELASILDRILKDATVRTETRGLAYICIDLPDCGKLYDLGLSSSHFSWEKLPPSIGAKSPVRKLLLRQFAESGDLLEDDPNMVLFTRTLLYMYKKLEVPHTEQSVRASISEFVKTDSELPDSIHIWSDKQVTFNHDLRRIEWNKLVESGALPKRLLTILWDIAERVSSSFPYDDLLDPGHGPGAVAEGTRFRDKYVFENWPEKLEHMFPAYLYASHNLTRPTGLVDHVPPARLLAVPKTLKGPRLITAEPQAFVFCQKAVLSYLRSYMPRWIGGSEGCYQFESQEGNRSLAMLASKHSQYATVDLKEASDRLSLWAIDLLLGGNEYLISLLSSCRSDVVRLPDSDDTLTLRKYAGMGNATTFPIQSIFYSMLCLASVLYADNEGVTLVALKNAAKRIQVFGDDIIVPNEALPSLAMLLSAFHLKINTSKTHWAGHFRESCGADCFHGFDVTPFYFHKRDIATPEDLVSWVEVSNNAYKCGFWNLASWMVEETKRLVPCKRHKRSGKSRKTLPLHKAARCIPTSNGAFGVSFLSFQNGTHGVESRFSTAYHVMEYRVASPRSVSTREVRESEASLLQYFVEAPSPETFWTAGWYSDGGVTLHLRWEQA